MNQLTLTPLFSLVFAVLAYFKVALPETLTQTAVVATAMLALSTWTMIVRFQVGGGDDGPKAWWQSRIIVANIVAVVFAVLALFGVIPNLAPQVAVEMVMGVIGAASFVFALKPQKQIA